MEPELKVTKDMAIRMLLENMYQKGRYDGLRGVNQFAERMKDNLVQEMTEEIIK